MGRPNLDSPHFNDAWERLLNSKVFKDDRVSFIPKLIMSNLSNQYLNHIYHFQTHLFWRKMTEAIENFCLDLWTSLDGVVEEFSEGLSIVIFIFNLPK